MNQVTELLDRVVEALRESGIEPYFIDGFHKGWIAGEYPDGIQLDVKQTFRMNNRDLENVTVTIDVVNWNGRSGHRIARIKVPKNASDKVINNRVEKVLNLMQK